jgi:hypothetical protein
MKHCPTYLVMRKCNNLLYEICVGVLIMKKKRSEILLPLLKNINDSSLVRSLHKRKHEHLY